MKHSQEFKDQLLSSVSYEAAQLYISEMFSVEIAHKTAQLKTAPDWNTARLLQGDINALERLQSYLVRNK